MPQKQRQFGLYRCGILPQLRAAPARVNTAILPLPGIPRRRVPGPTARDLEHLPPLPALRWRSSASELTRLRKLR